MMFGKRLVFKENYYYSFLYYYIIPKRLRNYGFGRSILIVNHAITNNE
jgi:hypothetical protein